MLDAQLGHQLHVVFEAMIVVAGHVARVAVDGAAGRVAEGVPDARLCGRPRPLRLRPGRRRWPLPTRSSAESPPHRRSPRAGAARARLPPHRAIDLPPAPCRRCPCPPISRILDVALRSSLLKPWGTINDTLPFCNAIFRSCQQSSLRHYRRVGQVRLRAPAHQTAQWVGRARSALVPPYGLSTIVTPRSRSSPGFAACRRRNRGPPRCNRPKAAREPR